MPALRPTPTTASLVQRQPLDIGGVAQDAGAGIGGAAQSGMAGAGGVATTVASGAGGAIETVANAPNAAMSAGAHVSPLININTQTDISRPLVIESSMTRLSSLRRSALSRLWCVSLMSRSHTLADRSDLHLSCFDASPLAIYPYEKKGEDVLAGST